MSTSPQDLQLGSYKYGWHDEGKPVFEPKKGLSREVVEEISALKDEPTWMRDLRLKSYEHFRRRPMPGWGGNLSDIDFDNIYYFVRSTEKQATSWDELPADIKNTYDKLGIPEAEKQRLIAGVAAQYESEVVYHKVREDLEAQGVIFLDTDTALREHEDLFREHFTKVIPANDNKFAALNTAVWSGGSFIWIPEGVKVDIPLQAYFRINQQNMGQFERTLIIAEPGSYVHYVEGCTAPIYSSDSLHSAVVEIICKPGSRVRYTTIQNWSNNVYNLVTKRAAAYEDATMEWIDGNIGCLAAGCRVTTRSGVKPIEEVTPGEEVLSFDEERGELCFRRVTAKRDSGQQPVREVRVGQRRLRVTDNHPFYSWLPDPERAKKLGRSRLGYVRADHLAEAIVPVSSIDYGEPYKLELPDNATVFTGVRETTHDFMRLVGQWLAHVPDTPGGERADGVAIRWSSVELVELLQRNGFVGNAGSRRLPDWVLDLPESQRLALVAGYLDADGCATKGRRGLSLKSVNRPLLEDVADVLTSLGIPALLHTEFDDERQVEAVGRRVVARDAHRLDIRADARLVAAVSPGLREAVVGQRPARLRHFRAVGRSNIELPETVEVRKVAVSEPLETVPTWDIEVEGTGNFVAEGFIVHNSKLTMKYPAVWLMGRGARGEVLSVAFAGDGQHQDAGAKMVHHAPDTSSTIVSKSVSQGHGRTSYRGLVDVAEGAHRVKSNVVCDALLLDETARSDTYPYMNIAEEDAQIGHEASVSRIGEEQLFYLMSRGVDEAEAQAMIVRGFIEPISKELPMEYSVELNRLISLNMEGSVG